MAKRKTAKKTATRRKSRRVSGLFANGMLEKVGGALVGYVVAKMVSGKVLPKLDEKIKGASVAAIGLFVIPKVLKNSLGEGMAIGFGVAGGQMVLTSTGLLAGVDTFLPYNSRPFLAGMNDMAVNGTDGIPSKVNGISNKVKRSEP